MFTKPCLREIKDGYINIGMYMNTGGKERKNVIDTLSKRKRTDFELGSRF